MDYGKIFRQAWKNVISYRALWIFGVILALTTASSSNSYFSSGSSWRTNEQDARQFFTYEPETPGEFFEMLPEMIDEAVQEIQRGIEEANRDLTRFFQEDLGLPWRANILAILSVLVWTLVIFIIVGTIFRYVSETALIRMVDDQEEFGERRTVRYGFRAGWSRTSWRLFLIDLAISIPAFILFVALFALVFAPLLLIGTGIAGFSVIGIVLTSGFFLLFIIAAIVFDQVIKVLRQYVRRASVLEGLGVFDSIRRGAAMFRHNLSETGLVWLVLVGINIVWPIAIAIAAVVFAAVSAVIGGLFGILTGFAAIIIPGASPIAVGIIVGGTIGLIFLVLPLLLLDGMRIVFMSSSWTLLFRELNLKSSIENLQVPELDEALAEIPDEGSSPDEEDPEEPAGENE